MPATLATPLGPILNEALTNALKHAFPNQRAGTISVELTETGRRQYHLSIADDGVGYPPGPDLEHSNMIIISMMRGLSGQLDDHLRISL